MLIIVVCICRAPNCSSAHMTSLGRTQIIIHQCIPAIRGGQERRYQSPKAATFWCFVWSILNICICIAGILLLLPNVAIDDDLPTTEQCTIYLSISPLLNYQRALFSDFNISNIQYYPVLYVCIQAVLEANEYTTLRAKV